MPSPDVVIDLDEALTYCDHDQEFLRTVLEQYWQLWPDTRASLEQAIAERDVLALRKIAHLLKGQAAAIAAGQVQSLARQLEQSAPEVPQEALQALFDALLDAQRTLRMVLNEQGLILSDQLPPL